MFLQSSRFVLKSRIGSITGTDSRAEIFRKRDRLFRPHEPGNSIRRRTVAATVTSHFAIAGARSTAFKICGRMSVVVALSWIGGRGSFAVPFSMMKV